VGTTSTTIGIIDWLVTTIASAVKGENWASSQSSSLGLPG
jgi:hypothetical protein